MSTLTALPARPDTRIWPLLAAQAAAGAGAKFHSVALSLLILLSDGLSAMSGFIASGLLGSVAAVATAAFASRRLTGRQLMIASAVLLLGARTVAYLLVAVAAPVWTLLIGQFVGSVAGTVLINCSKSQAPASRRVRTLAWMGVANGAGGILGAGAAGVVTTGWAHWALVTTGMTAAVVATTPMLALSRRTSTQPVPLTDQLRAARRVLMPVLLGGSCFAAVGGFSLLANGLVADLYGPRWVGPLTACVVAGSWLAAASIGRVQQTLRRLPTVVSWPAAGLTALACWSIADRGLGWLLLAAGVSGLLLGWVAVSVEARVLERAGSAGAPALTFSGAAAALLSAGSVQAVPSALDTHGYGVTVLWLAAGLATVAGLLAIVRHAVPGRGRCDRAAPSATAEIPMELAA